MVCPFMDKGGGLAAVGLPGMTPGRRIGVKPEARHPGGINIFGRGFGNYDQDIVLRLDIED